MLTENVPDAICTFDNDADDSVRTRTDVFLGGGGFCAISEMVLWSLVSEMVLCLYICYSV